MEFSWLQKPQELSFLDKKVNLSTIMLVFKNLSVERTLEPHFSFLTVTKYTDLYTTLLNSYLQSDTLC